MRPRDLESPTFSPCLNHLGKPMGQLGKTERPKGLHWEHIWSQPVVWLGKVTQPLAIVAFPAVKSEVRAKIKPRGSISSQSQWFLCLFVFVVVCFTLLCRISKIKALFIYSNNNSAEVNQMLWNSFSGLYLAVGVEILGKELLRIASGPGKMGWQRGHQAKGTPVHPWPTLLSLQVGKENPNQEAYTHTFLSPALGWSVWVPSSLRSPLSKAGGQDTHDRENSTPASVLAFFPGHREQGGQVGASISMVPAFCRSACRDHHRWGGKAKSTWHLLLLTHPHFAPDRKSPFGAPRREPFVIPRRLYHKGDFGASLVGNLGLSV